MTPSINSAAWCDRDLIETTNPAVLPERRVWSPGTHLRTYVVERLYSKAYAEVFSGCFGFPSSELPVCERKSLRIAQKMRASLVRGPRAEYLA